MLHNNSLNKGVRIFVATAVTGKLVCHKMLVPQFALFQGEIMQKNKTVTFNESNKYTKPAKKCDY